MRDLAEAGLDVVTPRRLAVAGVIALIVVGVPGILNATGVIDGGLFDLNGERDIPAAVSAAILVFAAGMALAYGFVLPKGAPGRRGTFLLSLLFGYMALDEFGQIHERLEHITGVDWETLYLPVFALAGVTALIVVRAWKGNPLARRLLIVGGLLWLASQSLEFFEYDAYDVRVRFYELLVVIEELLEITGSLLLAASFLVAGQRTLAVDRANAVLQARVPPAKAFEPPPSPPPAPLPGRPAPVDAERRRHDVPVS